MAENTKEYASVYSGAEIDNRLNQGTYLDAVAAGFTGTKEEFDNLLAVLSVLNKVNPHIENTSNPHSVTKAQVGLENVDNESKQTMFTSPVFTGTPTTPLPTGDNQQQVVNVQYVINYINQGIDASKITTGTISVDRLPQGALERLVVVADDEARFALTTDNVQNGDTVKVQSSGLMYFVKDDTQLNNENGYEIYTSGGASSVPFSGIIGLPSWITNDKPTYTASEVGALPEDGTAVNAQKVANSFVLKINSGTTEGTNQYTFNGSAAKNLNITAGSNITFTPTEGGLQINAGSYTLNVASDSTLGGIQTGFTETGKKYAVKLEGNKAYVEVPWQNTTYSVATTSANGLMSSTDKNKLDNIEENANNYTLPVASSSALGGIQLGYTQTGNNYPVQLGENNQAFVHVPWSNTEYSQATADNFGLVKIGYVENNKNYPVELSEGKMFVNIPWTDTTYTKATNSALGLVMIGYSPTPGTKTYPLQLDSTGKAYVTVDWTDTTYSAASATNLGLVKIGSGISVAADGTISVTAQTITTQSVTALTGYTISVTGGALAATDSLNQALGKIEYRLNAVETELTGVSAAVTSLETAAQ